MGSHRPAGRPLKLSVLPIYDVRLLPLNHVLFHCRRISLEQMLLVLISQTRRELGRASVGRHVTLVCLTASCTACSFCRSNSLTSCSRAADSSASADRPSCPEHHCRRASSTARTEPNKTAIIRTCNAITPRSDQYQISPAASPEILHHTV